ncbi:NADH-dependent flavin oxidoreductase [Hyaloraphidium curvatum]|nr:NADH-dependent flavin oxidoreductase [Hyaloraphidium curvatum]
MLCRSSCSSQLCLPAAHVQARGQGFPGQLGIWSDDQIPGLARLAAAIKSYGSVSSVQLHHAGLRSPPDLIGEKPVGPSENAEWGARALSLEEVEQLKSDFIEGAVRAEKAGFDGVELHGAHGYILCAFNSSETNLRKDGYGGDLWHRTKILFDIIDGIRARCRPDFQLGVRLSPERFGIQLKEQIELVRVLLERQKLDYLDLSLWDCFKKPVEKEFAAKPLLDWFSDIPRHGCRVGCAGKLYAAEDYKRVLEHGYDFVIVGRAAILHHDLPQLVAKDPNWRAIKTPAPKEHLAREGLSPRFITYMNESFKGFVAN